ncbi:glycosyl transferase [Microvirga sp. 2MCAF35]|uniref:glycosyl transferase n=1 Tax=Microvirga sp. 2MCAF35 TaxID=3232987 RepID=UPI003F9A9DF9
MIVVFALLASMFLSIVLILALKPLLIRYALARPNARSSHRAPTPQGGGIAVLAATLCVVGFLSIWLVLPVTYFLIVASAAVAFAVLGTADDIRPLPAWIRLVMQFIVVAAVVLEPESRIFPDYIPLAAERVLLIIGGVWFVNLVNFMDGLDWISVAEMIPITAFIAGSGLIGVIPMWIAVLAAALCGALLGFAPFNKPVARLFLGDVGSLSIGLLVGWMLLQLAGSGGLAAALLLPLYYLMDATITLLRRLARGEKVWEAHRSHFYQKATDNGFSVLQVNAHVFGLNLVLAGLAAMTLVWPSGAVQIAALSLGAALVGLVLRRFSRPRVSVPLEVSR